MIMPGQRVVAAAVLLGQLLEAEPVLQLGRRDQAVDQPAAVVAAAPPTSLRPGGAEFAGDRLQHVAHGDHALHLAVFVDHEHQLRARCAELLEQFHAGQRLGHEHRRLQVLGRATSGWPWIELLQQRLRALTTPSTSSRPPRHTG